MDRGQGQGQGHDRGQMASYLDVVAGDDVADGPEGGRDDGLVVVHHQLHEAPTDSGIDHGLGRGEKRRVKNIRSKMVGGTTGVLKETEV